MSSNASLVPRELRMARSYAELVKRMPSVKKLLDTGSADKLEELYKQVGA